MEKKGFDDYSRDLPADGREHQLYLKILGDFPALIWRAGTSSACDWFNTTWLEFTGRSMEQEQGNGWAEGVHPDDLEPCVAYYLEHFNQRLPFRMEYRLRHNSGEYRWILDIGRPFFDLDGSFLGYIGSCYDITENHRMVHELKEIGLFRDRVFSIIGHDLRNQVGGMSGLADLLVDEMPTSAPADYREVAQGLRQVTDASMDLLNKLLGWSSARLGLTKANLVMTDVSDMVRDTVRLSQSLVVAKGLNIRMDLAELRSIMTDANMFQTILRNFISNAIKFTPRSGWIRVFSRMNGTGLQVGVEDSGKGMSADTLRTLTMESESVISEPGTENEKGIGLGLMLCRELLNLLGGKMLIDSQIGKGTVFIMEFPLDQAGGAVSI